MMPLASTAHCCTQADARAHARKQAQKIAKEEMRQGASNYVESFVVVKDESGSAIYRVPIEMKSKKP